MRAVIALTFAVVAMMGLASWFGAEWMETLEEKEILEEKVSTLEEELKTCRQSIVKLNDHDEALFKEYKNWFSSLQDLFTYWDDIAVNDLSKYSDRIEDARSSREYFVSSNACIKLEQSRTT